MAKTPIVSMKALLEAGVHFGHRTRRWNPKMKPFIFTERNGIHIIDLQQTIVHLNQAYELVKDTVASGGTILFVGTKRQAQDSIVEEAGRCHMPYVEQRWLGGTLTNWRTIRQRIDYLLEIEKQQERGEFNFLPKKEGLLREREVARLNHRLGGLKGMKRLPNLLFIVDVRRDDLAVKEANILGIPIIAMVDTNCDPDPIDHVIPSNDDAIRAIKLMVSTMASAVLEGQAILTSLQAEEEEAEGMEEEQVMERYLGPSTLAKIQAAAEAEQETEEAAEAEAPEAVPEEEVAEAEAPEPAPEEEPAEAEAPEAVPEEEVVEAEAPEAVPEEEVAEAEAPEPAPEEEAAEAEAPEAVPEEEVVEAEAPEAVAEEEVVEAEAPEAAPEEETKEPTETPEEAVAEAETESSEEAEEIEDASEADEEPEKVKQE